MNLPGRSHQDITKQPIHLENIRNAVNLPGRSHQDLVVGGLKQIKHIIAIKEAERLEIKIRTLDDIIGEEDKSE